MQARPICNPEFCRTSPFWGISAASPAPAYIPSPVSYTHLDVYKRQQFQLEHPRLCLYPLPGYTPFQQADQELLPQNGQAFLIIAPQFFHITLIRELLVQLAFQLFERLRKLDVYKRQAKNRRCPIHQYLDLRQRQRLPPGNPGKTQDVYKRQP